MKENKYIMIFLTESLPSMKYFSDTALNASMQFIKDYVDLSNEDKFDAKEGRTEEEILLKIVPNAELAKMLEINKNRTYNVMVMREDKLQNIDKNFAEQFDY